MKRSLNATGCPSLFYTILRWAPVHPRVFLSDLQIDREISFDAEVQSLRQERAQLMEDCEAYISKDEQGTLRASIFESLLRLNIPFLVLSLLQSQREKLWWPTRQPRSGFL